ncbi:hypothetical protein [Moritella dasanensis]|uniref:hypothetical protein n=1 Tax=Moritella dasanensis TaxID=428031 RepID=UPI00030D1D55|nr:hypothetical protein [Moritella dasanensis]
MKKLSFLAASVALVLSGCGSDSDPTTAPANPTVSNAFIDAAVEGIYYSAMPSGMSGFTQSDGSYEAKEQDTITFFLGGENGVKIGAASNREVLTPFEAAGKYNRALNLAIILQSLDNGSDGDSVITIPEELKDMSDPIILAALADLDLDSRTSSTDFLTAVGVSNIVEEDVAIEHMDASFGEMARGSGAPVAFFQQGSNSIIRAIHVTQYETNTSNVTYVHADKMLKDKLFEDTRGMPNQEYRLDSDKIVVLPGSNDSSISGDYAKNYLDCLGDDAGYTWTHEDPGTCSGTPTSTDHHQLDISFSYNLLAEDTERAIDKDELWSEAWLPLGAVNEQALNHYSDTVVDDRDDGEANPAWQREIISGSYDPITQIYSEIRKKIKLINCSDNNTGTDCTDDRTEENVSFYYEVASSGEERYVDFKGTWKSSEICEDGSIVKAQYVYSDSDMRMSGFECQSENGNPSVPSELEPGPYSYAELADIDYWWFNQDGRKSQATLTELNSVVRFCDDSNYDRNDPASVCGDEYFVKWNYQPAGKDWDEGLLIRHKMLPNGDIDGTITMQKVK